MIGNEVLEITLQKLAYFLFDFYIICNLLLKAKS